MNGLTKEDLLRFAHQHGFNFGFTEKDATLTELAGYLRIHAKTKVNLCKVAKTITTQLKVEKFLNVYGD